MGKKYNFIGDDMIEKFETHNDGIGDESKGSTYKGQIETSFAVLCEIFGEPSLIGGREAHWTIKFPDGKIATIYNYTNASNSSCRLWNVGGFESIVVQRISRLIKWKGFFVVDTDINLKGITT